MFVICIRFEVVELKLNMEHYLGKMYENFGVGPLSALFCACVIGMFVLICLPKRLHTLYGYVSLCTTMFAYSWSLLL